MGSKQKTLQDIFANLKLGSTDVNVFASPVYPQWEAFARKANLLSKEAISRLRSDFLADYNKAASAYSHVNDQHFEKD